MARTKDYKTMLAELAQQGDEDARIALEAMGKIQSRGGMFDADALRKRASKMLKLHSKALLWGEIRGEIASARRIILETAAENPSPGLDSDVNGILAVSVRNLRKGKEKVPVAYSPEGEALREIFLRIVPGGADYDSLPDPKDD